MKKHWLTIALLVSIHAALSACGGKLSGVAEGVVELRREELAVSMIIMNLRDAYNEPNEPPPLGSRGKSASFVSRSGSRETIRLMFW